MMRNKIAVAAMIAIVSPSMAMAAETNLLLAPAASTTVSYAAPMSFGKSLNTGRTGIRTRKGGESSLDGGGVIVSAAFGAVIGGVVCHETDLCGSNGHNGSVSP